MLSSAEVLSEKATGNFIIPTDLKREGVAQISESLNLLLADVFALKDQKLPLAH